MELSQRVLAASESQTLAIAAKAKAMRARGIKVIDFSAGEPDFPTPEVIKHAAIKAINEDFTHYTDVRGIFPLREAIAEKLRIENKIEFVTPETVLVTVGAKHAIFAALLAICNPGDEVLIPVPYWVSYPSMVHIAGAQPKFLQTNPATGFKITPKQLLENISKNTKCLIINSPANPTGAVYTEDELSAIAEIVSQHDLFVISDEIYEKILFDQKLHFSIGAIPDVQEKVITVNGFSKCYSMTGWRIGYVAASKYVIEQIKKVIAQSVTHPTSFVQKAAIAALTEAGEEVQRMIRVFQERRNLLVSALSESTHLQFLVPEGAFYLFLNLQSLLQEVGINSEDFAHYLLEKKYTATVPGDAFGMKGYLRISFATSEEDILRGAEAILQACNELIS